MDQEDLRRKLDEAHAHAARLQAELDATRAENTLQGDRIQRVEAQLIEQDHRLPHIVWNFFKRGWFGSTDPLRTSSRKAFVWFWFRPTTIAVAAGGLAAWFSVVLLHRQNALVAQQTDAVIEQNKKFDSQLEQINKQLALQESKDKAERDADYETRKAQLLAIIYDSEQRWPWSTPEPKASLRARQESATSFSRLQTANGQPVDLRRSNLRGAILRHAILRGADLRRADLRDTDLRRVNLSGANLSRADLSSASLSRTDLVDADLGCAILTRANLIDANLIGADLTGADLTGAYLYGAILTDRKSVV